MRSIPASMTWEILRRGRWHFVLSILGAFALPAFILAALSHDGPVGPQDKSMLMMHVVMVINSMFLFGAAIFAAQGKISRLYAYPLRTSAIVAWRMVPAMAIIALQMVVNIALINLLFHVQWPVLGPAMVAAVSIAAVDAAVWLTEKSIYWLIASMTALGTLLGLWFRSRYGGMFSEPTHFWQEVSATDVFVMLVIAGASYYVGAIAVARNRRGDPPLSLGLADWLNRTFEAMLPSSEPRFESAFRARCWVEWKRKGWIMPFGVLAAIPFGIVGWLVTSRQADDLLAGFFGSAIILPLLAFAAGGVFGNLGPNDANYGMGHFLATRPISNSDMARATLWMTAKSVFLGWLIWAVACAIACACVAAAGGSALLNAFLKSPDDISWWYFPATLLVPWMVAATFTALGMLGRSKPVLLMLCGAVAIVLQIPMASILRLPTAERLIMQQTTIAVIGCLLIVGSIWIFIAARHRKLIEWQTIWVAAGVWAILTFAAIACWPAHASPGLLAYFLAAGILTLSVVPVAAAPLAISLNRHR
jgi:hypothetical protein